MPKASLIISVFRKKEELGLIFRAIKQQTFKEFEVIVADDDSGNDMAGHVAELTGKYGIETRMVTHSFTGFGKNIILNKAIRESRSDYLIFIDGDCIPHRAFIEGHLRERGANTVLCGRRVMLGEKLSARLKEDAAVMGHGSISYFSLLGDMFSKPNPAYHTEEALSIKSRMLRRLRGTAITLSGCNFSLDRKLMEKINGFDEDYTGPGIGEDSDLEFRLRLAGAELRSVRNLAVLYHMYHPLTTENNSNWEHFHEVAQKTGTYFCKNGLIKTNEQAVKAIPEK
ncbi:MAG: glycosyltransferase [Ignavibacteria bacterium]|nr:glycosyltransferase [Ignavibacteria bacterium]